MENVLISITIICFFAVLTIVIYSRIKVVKAYGVLVKNRVDFGASHIFSPKKLEEEIIPKYPEQEKAIRQFCGGIRFTVRMATVLTTIATICVLILMYNS